MKPIYFHKDHKSAFDREYTMAPSGNLQRSPKRIPKGHLLGLARIGYWLPFIIVCMLLYSCEGRLDLTPETSFSEVTFFKTADQFKLFANQFYANLPPVGFSTTRDAYADLLVERTINTVSDGSYSATPSSDLWQNAYSTIRNTTYLIEKGDAADADLKPQVAVYVAEAKFFRAMAYFNLLKDFGGVPIINKVLTLTDDSLLYGPRNTRDEVVNYILNDLDSAIAVLPLESDIAAGDKGRVSKGAALAIKARVALFEGTWRKFRGMDGYEAFLDQAIEASGQVMNSHQYEIFDRRDVLGDDSYRYFLILDEKQSNPANLTKADQHEYIFVSRYDATIRPQPLVDFLHGASPTKKFADMFLCTDGLPIDKSPLFKGKKTNTSEYENRDLRMKNIFVIPGSQVWESTPLSYVRDWSNPYAGGYPDVAAGSNVVVFGQSTLTGYEEHKFSPEIYNPSMDFPVIRYAEVLLINAEALFEKNGMITDAQLDQTINLLRERSGVAKLSNEFASLYGLDMRTEIRRARTIELFKEGHRFDDLRRWKTAETELPEALEGVLWTGTQYETDPQYNGITYPLDAQGNIIIEDASKRHFDPNKNYLFPLPTRQLLLDPQLAQNPGW